jgi:hypothetical protein
MSKLTFTMEMREYFQREKMNYEEREMSTFWRWSYKLLYGMAERKYCLSIGR